MDKYDYITATIDEEKVRVEKIIAYLEEEKKYDEVLEYKERYNNINIYLNAKNRYMTILNSINSDKERLEVLNKTKDEYEVDNILLEDTLLSKFNEDTNSKYRNIFFENIKYEEDEVRDILYLLFEKQSNYSDLINKRNKLIELVDEFKYPSTYSTLHSQSILIKKQESTLDEIYIIKNNIEIKENKLRNIEKSIMTTPILKLLYEFWIIDTYDKDRVNKNKLFKDHRSLVNVKNDIEEEKIEIKEKLEEIPVVKEERLIPNLNLPGIDENTLIDIDGKNYVKDDK